MNQDTLFQSNSKGLQGAGLFVLPNKEVLYLFVQIVYGTIFKKFFLPATKYSRLQSAFVLQNGENPDNLSLKNHD